MSENIVPVSDKVFIGIGKIYIDTLNEAWNIPHLHFIVNRCTDGLLEATCLEFGLTVCGGSLEETISRLIDLTQFHISAVMTEGTGFDDFIDTVENHFMDNFWAAYRSIEFKLARTKQDLSHAIDEHINRAVERMISQKTGELIRQIAAEQAQDIVDKAIAEFERLNKFKSIYVKYSELKDAA